MVNDDQRNGKVSERSVAQLVSDLSEQTSRLVRDEVKLAVAEMQRKGKRLGLGAGLAGAGGLVALYGLAALVAAAILALALVLPSWASALIIAGGLFLLAGLLAVLGREQIHRGTPPMPREAVESVRRDIDTVKEKMHR